MKATLLARAGPTDRKEYVLEEGKTYLVGRSREADIIVKDKLASRNHCKIVAAAGDEWTVADLGSSNGTHVNRQRVTTHVLRDGDVVQIGRAALEFRHTAAAVAPTPPRREAAQGPPPESEETDAPPRPTEVPPPEPAPAPQPAESAPAEAPQPAKAKQEPDDEDLRGLFEFLDKLDSGERPAAEAPAAAASPDKKPTEKIPSSEAPPRARPEREPPAKPKEEGGLLAFLRKKKKQP